MSEVLSKPHPNLTDVLFSQTEAWALQRAAMKRMDAARAMLAAISHSGLRASGPAIALLLEDAAKLYQTAFTQALGQEVQP